MRLYTRDEGPVLELPYHPDPFAEAVRWETAEGCVIQAVGRARGLNRTLDNPVHVDIISEAVLPIELDAFVEWDDAQKVVDAMMLAAKGFILGEGRDTAAFASGLAPETWSTADVFDDWRNRGGAAALRLMVENAPSSSPVSAVESAKSILLENADSTGHLSEHTTR